MPPKNTQLPEKKSSRRFITWTLLIGFLAALLLVMEHQAVYDWLRLRGYTPPSNITQIAADDELTAKARHIFFVNHPLVQNKTDFASSCPNGGKETAVLGCYIPAQTGIYVLHVSDSRLSGIEQVTAAHEMLHAAYDRLSKHDKQEVDGWLQSYYDHDLTDQTIKDQIDSYKKTEPNDLVNEMHSVFGTEVPNLPSNLETYYQRYFSDRSKITSYYATYEGEFTSRIQQIKQDDAQLASLKLQIQSGEADLKAKQAELSSQQSQLDSDRRSGNVGAYNAGVPAYNAIVDAYNTEVRRVQSLVSQYNMLVSKRNAIALEEQQLTQAISSNVAPIGSH